VSCAKSIACLSGMKLKDFVSFHSTLLWPFDEYIVPGFQLKTSCFQLHYQCHSSNFWAFDRLSSISGSKVM